MLMPLSGLFFLEVVEAKINHGAPLIESADALPRNKLAPVAMVS
jgi:hypothetical protein